MRFKQMTRWAFLNTLKGYGVFIGVYWAVILIVSIFISVNLGHGQLGGSTFSGGGSTALFMFIFGIVGFSAFLRVGFANGITRKTVFLSNLACFTAMAAISALGEIVIAFISCLIMGLDPASLLSFFGAPFATFADWLIYYLFSICIILTAVSCGLFIGGAFYRMSKIAKILVSVFAGIFLFFGIPALALLSQVEFLQVLAVNVLFPVLNFFTSTVWASMLGLILLTALFLLFTWLCMRKAPAKAAK